MMDQSREPPPEHRFDLQELLRELVEQEHLATASFARDEFPVPPPPDQGLAFGSSRAVQGNDRG